MAENRQALRRQYERIGRSMPSWLTQNRTSQNSLNNVELENITDNITEFNNQLYQWRNRIEINPDDQVRVIRDTIDETRSMVR